MLNPKDLELCERLVQAATKLGAHSADAMMGRSTEFDVTVRDGRVEDVSRSTDKTIGLRVFLEGAEGRKLGFITTSVVPNTADDVESVVRRALGMAEAAAASKWHGLPDKADVEAPLDVKMLDLYDPRVAELTPEWAAQQALTMEKVAKGAEPRIHAFGSVGAGAGHGGVAYVNSNGFSGAYEGSHVSAHCHAVTLSDGNRQSDGWSEAQRHLKDLLPPEDIARKAAQRVGRAVGAKPGPMGKYPVIYEAPVALSILGHISGAVSGDLVAKGATFMASLVGQQVAPAFFNLSDDSTIPRALGSSPFDGEGLRSRVNKILDGGVLQGFLCDTFTARRLGRKSTGSARRGAGSLPHIGVGNIRLQPGTESLEQLAKRVGRGLLVTRMLGHGPDLVTGDYSRGAGGMWIENGELAYPVEEMTVAGNLVDMLKGIAAVGSDLLVRGGTASPSIMFQELTVSSRG
ncbi:MAG: TldD/PmbA family protein [Myxococcota bacterium]